MREREREREREEREKKTIYGIYEQNKISKSLNYIVKEKILENFQQKNGKSELNKMIMCIKIYN